MRLFRRKPKPEDPVQKLAGLMLDLAVNHLSAKAIVFGVPQGVQWDPEVAKRKDDEAMAQDPLLAQMSGLSAEQHLLVSRTASLRYRNGYGSIPVWWEGPNGFHELMPLSGGIYIGVLAAFGELVVSLGATAEVPQPQRYIEVKSSSNGVRRFAEVEFIMGEDNTVHIEIVGVREEGKDTRVSGRACVRGGRWQVA